ncbi:PepSY domain-containing protein [Orrella marina]|nr:PepSY domain-containing protein [Orrella marina]
MRKLNAKSMIKSLSAVAMTGAVLGAAFLPAQAQNAVSGEFQRARTVTVAQADGTPQWLSMNRIIDRIEAAGYTDIREVERERGGYEAEVRDDQGRKVKLYLDPRTGEIINSRTRDRRD